MKKKISPRAAAEPIDPLVWKIAGVAMLGPLMTTLDSTIVNVSLSALGRELHSPLTVIQWVTSGYLLAMALMLPLSGWLVDRVGAKRVYLGCFSVFTLTSLLCGAATSTEGLILSRILQGAAGGLLAPMAQMMMARVAGRHIARVMSIAIMPVMIGPILGPAVAGFILQHASWRWIFFINLPIGVLATGLAFYVLPNDGHETLRRPFDLPGFLMLSPAIALLMHGLDVLGMGSPGSWIIDAELGLAALLLTAFFWHANRHGRQALIDLELFRIRTFSAAAITQFFGNCVLFGSQMLFPLYLLTVGNYSPATTGLLLAPTGIGLLFVYPMLGRLIDRFGPRRVSSSGALIALLATVPFAVFDASVFSVPMLCVLFAVRGIGFGCINLPSISAAYASISRASIPMATTAINIVQRLGGPIATTFLAIYLHDHLSAPGHDAPGAFLATMRVFCVIQMLTIGAALMLPLRRAEAPKEDAALLAAAAE